MNHWSFIFFDLTRALATEDLKLLLVYLTDIRAFYIPKKKSNALLMIVKSLPPTEKHSLKTLIAFFIDERRGRSWL